MTDFKKVMHWMPGGFLRALGLLSIVSSGDQTFDHESSYIEA